MTQPRQDDNQPPPTAPVAAPFAPADVQQILEQLHRVPEMTISDVLALYAQPVDVTQPEAEQAALLRSFGGICAYPEANWVSHRTLSQCHRTDRDV